MRKVAGIILAVFLLTTFVGVIPGGGLRVAAATKPTVYICGDSTVQTYSSSYAPQAGWGQMIAKYFTGDVLFVNRAIAGRSSKSFIADGRLDAIINVIQPNDYLFVQFGHNDATVSKPERYTEPNTEYKEYLRQYIDKARSKNAIPVLITPVARLNYSNGIYKNDFPAYCTAMKEVAAEKNVPCIDLMSNCISYYNTLTYDQVYKFYLVSSNGTDYTHFTETGATEVARIVAEGVKALNLPISKYVINVSSTSPAVITPKPSNTAATQTFKPTNTPINTAPALSEDINGDRAINMADVMLLASHFNTTVSDGNYDRKCDLNNDGAINMSDVMMVAVKFNTVLASEMPSSTVKPTPMQVTLPPVPVFKDVSVHDPSIMKTNGTYYIIGSHLASAKTNDLIQWQQISSGVSNTNPLIPNVYTELKASFDYAQTSTLWAGDIIQLKDGKYYMYYCACKGDSPLSTLGVAVSSNADGPYKDLGIILKSGMSGVSADGTNYNSTIHPNVVDPDVFFDKNGDLWMVYGSYSGGIFILKMDPATAKPLAGQGYGKKLLGANHSRIEGPFMLYSPDSDYYYLFLSFGGLDSNGGYNIRVCRSRNPDGPFVDAAGKNMIDCHGPAGSFFDDRAIEPYGTKLIGNFRFVESNIGYVSPGHNSAYYDAEIKKYFNVFHTRFPGQGEEHQVRVHQMFINSDGWPVIAPHRYAGETIGQYSLDEVIGDYDYLNHGADISATLKGSVKISLNRDGTISGNINGVWRLNGENGIVLTINGVNYSGVVLRQWDNGLKKFVMTFSALMKNGNVAVWGSHI